MDSHLNIRTRRRLLTAVLPAALALAALPGAAHAAATVDVASDGTLNYQAGNRETNSLNVRVDGGAVEVKDFRGLTSRTPRCAQVTPQSVRCGIGITRMVARLGNFNDSASIRAPFRVFVDGGDGDDTFVAGHSPTSSNVEYAGHNGSDVVTYQGADTGVAISNDGIANDGRAGDRDSVRSDVERLTGSHSADQITDVGTCCVVTINGAHGADTLRGGATANSITRFDMGTVADGADRILAGAGTSTADYSRRTRSVTAKDSNGRADDGEAGEGDELIGGHESLVGGNAGDTLQVANGPFGAYILGHGGDDTITGTNAADSIYGGDGSDTISALGGNDVVNTIDSFADTVSCGAGVDTAEVDSRDGSSDCEKRRVGVLRLARKDIRAQAGKNAALRLSWRHPRSWKRLRRVDVRLVHENATVGSMTITPRSRQVSSAGAVKLVRSGTDVVRRGRTAKARLGMKIDPSLSDARLRVEIEGVDTSGARQVESNAGSIRVAD